MGRKGGDIISALLNQEVVEMNQSNVTTAAQKYRQAHGAHCASDKEVWTGRTPWLELDERAIDVDDAPRPCPKSTITKERIDDKVTYITRQGIAIVIPSPWVSSEVNKAAARFWYKHGFTKRDQWNCEDIQYSYIIEWVRMCDVPVNVEGKSVRYSAKAWLTWANREYRRLYLKR